MTNQHHRIRFKLRNSVQKLNSKWLAQVNYLWFLVFRFFFFLFLSLVSPHVYLYIIYEHHSHVRTNVSLFLFLPTDVEGLFCVWYLLFVCLFAGWIFVLLHTLGLFYTQLTITKHKHTTHATALWTGNFLFIVFWYTSSSTTVALASFAFI